MSTLSHLVSTLVMHPSTRSMRGPESGYVQLWTRLKGTSAEKARPMAPDVPGDAKLDGSPQPSSAPPHTHEHKTSADGLDRDGPGQPPVNPDQADSGGSSGRPPERRRPSPGRTGQGGTGSRGGAPRGTQSGGPRGAGAGPAHSREPRTRRGTPPPLPSPVMVHRRLRRRRVVPALPVPAVHPGADGLTVHPAGLRQVQDGRGRQTDRHRRDRDQPDHGHHEELESQGLHPGGLQSQRTGGRGPSARPATAGGGSGLLLRCAQQSHRGYPPLPHPLRTHRGALVLHLPQSYPRGGRWRDRRRHLRSGPEQGHPGDPGAGGRHLQGCRRGGRGYRGTARDHPVLEASRPVRQSGRPHPQRSATRGPAGHRQDLARQSHCRRSRGHLLREQRLGVRGDVRWRRRCSSPRPLRPGKESGTGHRLHRRDRRHRTESRSRAQRRGWQR